MAIRCPNFGDQNVRDEFNRVLARLGGRAMEASDVGGRQAYVADLTPDELSAYHRAHYYFDQHASPEALHGYLDLMDEVRGKTSAARPDAEHVAPASTSEAQPERGVVAEPEQPGVPSVEATPTPKRRLPGRRR